MAYLDPAPNLGSQPQKLGVKNCKGSTSDKLQTFKIIFEIFLQTSNQKLCLHWNHILFSSATLNSIRIFNEKLRQESMISLI